MSTTTKLTKYEQGKGVEEKLYKGMIGSFLYLTASRPDIMFSVYLSERFQSCPKEYHSSVVKRIFRYLINTKIVSLWYLRDDCLDLIGYSDADHAGNQLDRKSTSRTCQFLSNSLVS